MFSKTTDRRNWTFNHATTDSQKTQLFDFVFLTTIEIMYLLKNNKKNVVWSNDFRDIKIDCICRCGKLLNFLTFTICFKITVNIKFKFKIRLKFSTVQNWLLNPKDWRWCKKETLKYISFFEVVHSTWLRTRLTNSDFNTSKSTNPSDGYDYSFFTFPAHPMCFSYISSN